MGGAVSEKVAIIGAGVAGLGAAYELSRAGVESVVFEKSRGLSGRVATRRRGGIRYDYGANFFRLDEPWVARLLREDLGGFGLERIAKPVWIFDAEGNREAGDPAINAEPAWTCRGGIRAIGEALAEAAPGARVLRETRIVSVERDAAAWRLRDAAGEDRGVYHRVLLAFPGPQMAAVFPEAEAGLRSLLGGVEYESQFSFILGVEGRLAGGRPWHALLNHDRRHAIAWLSFEDDKPGHVPDRSTVIVVQMAPWWTEARFEGEPEQLLPEVLAAVRGLIDFPEPAWWDAQRWRFALPRAAVDVGALRRYEQEGLYFAGDAVVGKGRVTQALASGLEAAGRMLRRGCG